MLTSLRIQNFKSWRDTKEMSLAPLTVIFGENSSGKSSLGHLLLALKQTALSADRKRALNLGDSSTLIDLGTFEDCIHAHDLTQRLSFQIGWTLSERLQVRDFMNRHKRYAGNRLELNASLIADERDRQPRVCELSYVLREDLKTVLAVWLERTEDGKWDDPTAVPLQLIRNPGRPWPVEEPEKFYRLTERSIARYQNAGFMTDFALATEAMLRGVSYLGPLREPPQRTYQWSGDEPEDVGQNGKNAVAAILAADAAGRRLNRRRGAGRYTFAEFIARWLKDLGVIESFDLRQVAKGRKEYEVMIKNSPASAEVKIADVGFGVSQVLPAVVQAFYCPPNSTVWMEQPEIHLHPRIQAQLADVFISAVQAWEHGKPRNIQLIIETHSEHFLSRLQRRVAEESIDTTDVAVYYARRAGVSSKLDHLRLTDLGDIENWPENFFGDDLAESTARVVAAAARRNKRR
jgi:predicted ATPase